MENIIQNNIKECLSQKESSEDEDEIAQKIISSKKKISIYKKTKNYNIFEY